MNGKWNADLPDLPDLIMDQENQVYQRHQRSILRAVKRVMNAKTS